MKINKLTSRKSEILLHPYFLLSLLLLVLNDYLFKTMFHNYLTGKLSDFSGLFVFAIFLYVILPSSDKNRRRIARLCIAVGIAFIVWKLEPVEYIFAPVENLTHLPMPSRVKDVSDLSALAILPLSYLFITRNTGTTISLPSSCFVKRLAISAVLIVAGFNIVATTIGGRYTIKPEFIPNHNIDQNQLVYMIERTMTNNGFRIEGREIHQPDTLLITARGFINHSYNTKVIVFIANYNIPDSLRIAEINVRIFGLIKERQVVEDEIRRKIIEPFNSWIEALDESD